MNEFLKSRKDIDLATSTLKHFGYTNHPISAKDWELLKITNWIEHGDLADLGANGSFVIHNAIKKGIKGKKVGIDLAEVTGDNRAEGAEYVVGDLMETPFDDNSFDTITSQSVIEHNVDFSKFAKECARILKMAGRLVVSFDYWPEKIDTTGITLYGLSWNILDKQDVLNLILEMDRVGLEVSGEIDWTVGKPVITPQYCSPSPGISYTFGILEFIKRYQW